MSLTSWIPNAAPRLSPMRPTVSLRNDTHQIAYSLNGEMVERVMNLVNAHRIEEHRRLGLPLEWSDTLPVAQANAQIKQLLVEARQLNHSSAAFYVVGEG